MYLSESDVVLDVFLESVYRDSYLLHSVAVANCYAVVLNRVEVIGDTKRCTDLVLAAVSLTDRACLVEVNVEVLSEIVEHLACLFGKLLGERKNCSLEGRESGMKVKNNTDVILLCIDNLFVISINEECKSNAVCTERTVLSTPRLGSTT